MDFSLADSEPIQTNKSSNFKAVDKSIDKKHGDQSSTDL